LLIKHSNDLVTAIRIMLASFCQDEAAIVRGERTCRRITRHYAKTFYFASHCLPREVRRHAYAIYGFCRWADNAVDEAIGPEDAGRRLEFARRTLDLAYDDQAAPPGVLAFRRTVRERGIPRRLFDDLLDGMAMDLTIDRYPDFEALDLYCYRVAGVVGLMMTFVFGYRDRSCFPQALALGRGMQLTNIVRDIREDLGRGRVYLPQDELARFGVSEEQLAEGRVDDRFRDLLRFQIARARQAYADAERGIPLLIGTTSRLTVRVMGRLYGGILDEVERNDYDVFRNRARVSTPRKLRLLARCQVETMGEGLRRSWT
jgi:phytoene synthase